MPTITDEQKRWQVANSLLKRPDFATMPAAIQQTVRDYALTGRSSVPWSSVLSEARAANLIGPDSPWWAGLLAMGGAMAGGSALAGLTGGGAATAGAASGGGGFIADAIKKTAQTASGVSQGTDWMRTLAPLLGLGAMAATGGFFTPGSGMDQGIQKQIETMIARQNARGAQSDPIYDSAMKLASSLAPTSQNNPRLQEAIRDAGSPMPQRTLDPQVSEALARLMGGR